MDSGEVKNSEINLNNVGEDPWSKMEETAPPFGGETQKEDVAEADDYYTFEGVEYKNLNKIDISTEQGKYEYLDGWTENIIARCEHELEEAEYEDDERLAEEIKIELEEAQLRQRILRNKIDVDGKGVYGNLLEEHTDVSAKLVESTGEKFDRILPTHRAIEELISGLEFEMVRRDPNYFGQNDIEHQLQLEVARAERGVEETMADGYFGEDGFVHKAPEGEKMRTAATENAEIILNEAKQDAETFQTLMQNYGASVDYQVPRAIKKEDFVPTIDKFMAEHSVQIDKINADLKDLVKGTPEYDEAVAKRRELAKERSSAKRLATRFFEVPKGGHGSDKDVSGEDGQKIEQVPTGKTREQIETEESKKRQEKEAYQKRIDEYWEQKRRAEKKRREEAEEELEENEMSM